MSQYDELVERQRILLEAEEWANGVKEIHAHSINSMWYDNRPQDTEDGKSVLDVSYNSGLIKRKCHDGSIVYFGKEMTTNELIDAYGRAKAYDKRG